LIQVNKTWFSELNPDKISWLIKRAQSYFDNARELYERYSRKPETNRLMGGNGVTMPYEHYSVNIANGYIAGNPPIFTVADRVYGDNADGTFEKIFKMLAPERFEKRRAERAEAETAELQAIVDHITRYNDVGEIFSDSNKDLLMKTRGYIYVTENDSNEIEIVVLDSINAVCVYDYGTPPYPLALVRKWTEKNDKNKDEQRIEIITAEYRRIYDEKGNSVSFWDYDINGEYAEMTEKPLLWGNPDRGIALDVPVAPLVDPENIAIFEPALALIDSQQTVVTNIDKTLEYNIEPKLVITGDNPPSATVFDTETGEEKTNPARAEYENRIISAKVLFTDGQETKWLVRPVDFSGAISYLDNSTQYIAMFAGVPNVTDDSFGSAQSGVALGYKFYGFDLRCVDYYKIQQKAWKRVWELIINRINYKNGTDYDWRDVDVKFKPNIPTDADKNAALATTLFNAGIISQETAIGMGLDDIDPAAEMAKVKGEKLAIRTIRDLREAMAGELIDRDTALGFLFGEEQLQEIKERIDAVQAQREVFNELTEE
jgi:SPP1 family phage portal protein